MWFNVIFIAIMFIVAFVGFSGYAVAKGTEKPSAFEQLTIESLKNTLNQLPENPSNYDIPVGAMCYDTAAPMDRIQYTCPKCGEMTLYNSFYGDDIEELQDYRSLVKKITKINVKLDESQFCKKCNPDITSPQFGLIIKQGKKERKVYNINQEDIKLLYDFSEGKKEHIIYSKTYPMGEFKNRLEELLGTP
jgi:hypothetical protein